MARRDISQMNAGGIRYALDTYGLAVLSKADSQMELPSIGYMHERMDVSDHPSIMETMSSVESYKIQEQAYRAKHSEWAQKPEDERGEEPKFEIDPKIIPYLQKQLQTFELIKDHYTNVFYENFENLKVEQAKDYLSNRNGEIPYVTLPEKAKELMNKYGNSKIVEISEDDEESKKAKGLMINLPMARIQTELRSRVYGRVFSEGLERLVNGNQEEQRRAA